MMHVLQLAATSRCKINTACGIMQAVIGSSWFKLKKWMPGLCGITSGRRRGLWATRRRRRIPWRGRGWRGPVSA